MGQATVEVKYVNPPKQGKVNGSIKDATGQMYGVPPHLLPTFQQGATYNIDYSERNFNGAQYRTVTTAVLTAPPQASGGSYAGKYGKTDDATAERIFVCGALNAAIQGGHVEISSAVIGNVVNMLRLVWSETFGAGPKKNADMNDDIPF